MKRKDIKLGYHKTPDAIKRMGLDDLYSDFVRYSLEREKTHEVIMVLNPKHYQVKFHMEHIWNRREDLFTIYVETMFGGNKTIQKEDLFHVNAQFAFLEKEARKLVKEARKPKSPQNQTTTLHTA